MSLFSQALAERHVPAGRIQEYVHSVAAYIGFHGLRHPGELGLEHVSGFLGQLRRQPDVRFALHNCER